MLKGAKFHRWGTEHLVVLATIVGVAVILGIGSRYIAPQTRRKLEIILASLLLIVELGDMTYLLLFTNFDVKQSLPLHLCDLVCFVSAFALIFKLEWAKSVSFYCGLTFTVVATLLPGLREGFPSFHFVTFFSSHGLIIVSALYLLASGQMRPSVKQASRAVVVASGWALILYPINLLLGSNYFFVNHLPSPKSPLASLGPWPTYIMWVAILALLVWGLMTLPWEWKKSPKT